MIIHLAEEIKTSTRKKYKQN